MKTLMTPLRRPFTFFALIALFASVLWLTTGSAARAAYDSGDDDMVVFGGHQEVKEGQVVNGDLVVLGGAADVYGTVHGDAVAIGGAITVHPTGEVDGSFVSLGGAIDNQSEKTPHRPIQTPHHHYQMPTAPVVPGPPVMSEPETPVDNTSNFASGWTTFVLIDTVLVLLAFLLFPAKTRDAIDHLLANPLTVAIVGFFSPIIISLVLTALAITVIGIPLMPIVVILTALGYLIGKAAIAVFLGNRLFEVARVQQPKPIVGMLIGLLILAVISMFGWEGLVIYFLIAAMAIGVAFYGFGQAYSARRRASFATVPPAPHTPATPTAGFAPPAGPAPTGPPAVP